MGDADGTPKLNKFDACSGNPVLTRVGLDVCIESVFAADPKRNSGIGFGELNAKGADTAFAVGPKVPLNVVSMSGAGGEVLGNDQVGVNEGN